MNFPPVKVPPPLPCPSPQEDALLDTVMLRLRTSDGLDMASFGAAYGHEAAATVRSSLQRHVQSGLVLELPRLPIIITEPVMMVAGVPAESQGGCPPSGSGEAGEATPSSAAPAAAGDQRVPSAEDGAAAGDGGSSGSAKDGGSSSSSGISAASWDYRIRLSDPEGFLLSNSIISDVFAAFSFKPAKEYR